MKWILIIAATLLLTLSACSLLDQAMGVSIDPETGEPIQGPNPLAPVAGALAGPLGAAGAALLGNLYFYLRSRKFKKVAQVGISAMRKIRAAMADGTISEEDLLDILKDEQDEAGIRALVKTMIIQDKRAHA